MNSETIKGRLSQHVKRRLQSQDKIHPHLSTQNATKIIPIQPVIKEEETESSLVKSGKKRKMTKKSAIHSSSVDSNPDDDDKCEKRNEKPDTSVDILTLILNYKKSEFIRNPQIIELLSEISKKKSVSSGSTSELIQS